MTEYVITIDGYSSGLTPKAVKQMVEEQYPEDVGVQVEEA